MSSTHPIHLVEPPWWSPLVPDVGQEGRRLGLGGTDVAAVVGLNPYRTAWDVWAEKVGLVEPPELDHVPAVRWGKVLEPTIAETWAGNDRRVDLVEPGSVLVHPERPWLRGTPDRLAVDQALVLEIKTAGLRQAPFWGESGTDEIPEPYLAE